MKLRWRASGGPKKALGWIPFKTAAIAYKNGQLHYQGNPISLWDSYGLADYELRSGCFSEDARGRWYVNITVEKKVKPVGEGVGEDFMGPVEFGKPKKEAVGIDLGLRELASFSDPSMPPVDAQKFYVRLQGKLAVAQRAGKKERTSQSDSREDRECQKRLSA